MTGAWAARPTHTGPREKEHVAACGAGESNHDVRAAREASTQPDGGEARQSMGRWRGRVGDQRGHEGEDKSGSGCVRASSGPDEGRWGVRARSGASGTRRPAVRGKFW
jgi:hypothetical protein